MVRIWLAIFNIQLVIIWCRARSSAAKMELKRLKKQRIVDEKHAILCAVKITSICRVRIAKKRVGALRRLRRFLLLFVKAFFFSIRPNRSALKIQKRIRIFIARRRVAVRRLRHKSAIVIQTRARVMLAKSRVQRIIKQNRADFDRVVTTLQKNIRRMLARVLVKALRLEQMANAKTGTIKVNVSDFFI